MTAAALLFFLCGAHAVCDYPLQGDFLSRGKNHRNPIAGVPWYQCLLAHALIHGTAVAALTGVPALGLLECFWHTLIDYQKCAGRLSFNVDQALHILCKLLWLLLWLGFRAQGIR